MKRFQYLLLLLLSLLMFSCNENGKTLNPMSSKISGPFGDCFEVVARGYKVVGNQVNVEFLRTKDGAVDSQIVAEFLDDAGNVMGVSNLDANGDDFRFLLANKVGESSTIAFEIGNINPTQFRIVGAIPQKEDDEAPKMIVKADETNVVETVEEQESKYDEDEEENEEDSEEEEYEAFEEDSDVIEEIEETISTQTTTSSSSSSKDIDKLLDDYENFVDHYIALCKKAQKGDASAIVEYAVVLEKVEKLEKELDKSNDDLTIPQMERLMKITQKMNEAALEGLQQFDDLQQLNGVQF